MKTFRAPKVTRHRASWQKFTSVFDWFFTHRPVRDMASAALLLLAVGTPAAAERMAPEMQQRPNDRDVVWSLLLSSRVVDGDATETLFWYDATGARTPLSRLDWEMPRVAMPGGTASATSGRLTLHAGFWTAVTEGEDGHVLDYDWTDFGSATGRPFPIPMPMSSPRGRLTSVRSGLGSRTSSILRKPRET